MYVYVYVYVYIFIYLYLYSYIYTYKYLFIGPPVYQCGEHWSGGPGSLVRGAGKENSLLPPIGDDSRVTTAG